MITGVSHQYQQCIPSLSQQPSVESLPSKHETLSSNPNTTTKKKKKRRRRIEYFWLFQMRKLMLRQVNFFSLFVFPKMTSDSTRINK
jgi:hypothetical protein